MLGIGFTENRMLCRDYGCGLAAELLNKPDHLCPIEGEVLSSPPSQDRAC